MNRLLRDRRVWLAAAVVAALVGARVAGLDAALSLDTLARHRTALAVQVAADPVTARLLFVAAYLAATALSLPGTVILTVAGGLLFGAWQGTVMTVVGATAGATVAFRVARHWFGATGMAQLGQGAERMAAAIRRDQVPYLLMLRLVPLFPFFLVNLVAALVGVRTAAFVATTCVGILPATAVYSLAGAGLGKVLDAGEAPSLGQVLTPEMIAALCGLAALALLAVPLRRRFARVS